MPRTLLTSLALVALAGACSYDVEPFGLEADLGVPDLTEHAIFDLNGDGPRCPSGVFAAHGGELSEAPLDRWGAEALEPINVGDPLTTVVLDPARHTAGEASLRLDSKNGQAGLFYPGSRDARWDLTPYLYVSFTYTAENSAAANDPGWQGSQPRLLLVSGPSDYFEYIPVENRLPRTPGPMVGATVPLAGGFGWTRNKLGNPDLAHVRYLALTFDSWGAGFTVWIDDLRIGPGTFLDCP